MRELNQAELVQLRNGQVHLHRMDGSKASYPLYTVSLETCAQIPAPARPSSSVRAR